MRSKEGEPGNPGVYFYTGSSWHWVSQELAERFSKLGLNDWQSTREVWIYGPGRGMNLALVARVLADKGITDLSREVVEKLPPGSYISYKGEVFPNPRETTFYDILEPELSLSLRVNFFKALLRKHIHSFLKRTIY